jgi:pimeloyl-ACP methyl ester carboxylesterase
MSCTTPKPTVLFIHGSWHTPKHFERVCALFQSHGYPISCPQMPSAGNMPPIGLMDDALCIRSELERLIDNESKDVIVVAHSYGGIVGTQSIEKTFAKKEREESGNLGGVVRIIYMTAFITTKGESLGSALGGGPAPNTKLPPFIPVTVSCLSMVIFTCYIPLSRQILRFCKLGRWNLHDARTRESLLQRSFS